MIIQLPVRTEVLNRNEDLQLSGKLSVNVSISP